jgi:hypothetical protein
VVASVKLIARFDWSIEQNGVTGEKKCLRTDNPGDPLVEKIIFMLGATPNLLERSLLILHVC